MAKLGATEDAGAFASLLAAARRDPAIAAAVRVTALEPRRADCRDIIQRAIGRREIRDPQLATVLFETAIGQIMVRFLLRANGFDEPSQVDFVDNTLISVLKAHDTSTDTEGPAMATTEPGVMIVDHASTWLMVAFGGLFAGGILFVAVERTNLWRRMPIEQYATDFRRSLYRLDPLIPILGVVSALGGLVFALNTDGPGAVPAWIGIALIAVIMIASIGIAEPINSKFRRIPEGQAPEAQTNYESNGDGFT